MRRLIFSLLLLSSVAHAQLALKGTGLRFDPQASVPGNFGAGKVGIWVPSSGGNAGLPVFRKSDGSDVAMVGGTCGTCVVLSPGAQQTGSINVSSTVEGDGGFVGPSLTALASGALAITGNAASGTGLLGSVTLKGPGGAVTDVVIDTSASQTSGRVLKIANAGTAKVEFDGSGNIYMDVFTAGILNSAGNAGITWGSSGGAGLGVYNSVLAPYTDLLAGVTLGASNQRYVGVWSRSYNGVSQAPTFATTPSAFDCSGGGELVHYLYTGNSTITMVNGNPAEQCVIAFKHDGTATSFTMTFSGTNIKANGNVVEATANKYDIVSFTWDATDSAWVEQTRSSHL